MLEASSDQGRVASDSSQMIDDRVVAVSAVARDLSDQTELRRDRGNSPRAAGYDVEVAPRALTEALHRVGVALDLDRAQLDGDLTVLHTGEVLVRARDPSRGVTHVEVRRQGTEPRIDPGASAKEDVDVVGG